MKYVIFTLLLSSTMAFSDEPKPQLTYKGDLKIFDKVFETYEAGDVKVYVEKEAALKNGVNLLERAQETISNKEAIKRKIISEQPLFQFGAPFLNVGYTNLNRSAALAKRNNIANANGFETSESTDLVDGHSVMFFPISSIEFRPDILDRKYRLEFNVAGELSGNKRTDAEDDEKENYESINTTSVEGIGYVFSLDRDMAIFSVVDGYTGATMAAISAGLFYSQHQLKHYFGSQSKAETLRDAGLKMSYRWGGDDSLEQIYATVEFTTLIGKNTRSVSAAIKIGFPRYK